MDLELLVLIIKATPEINIHFCDEPLIQKLLYSLSITLYPSFSKETCHPDFIDQWSVENIESGHGDVVALIINQCFGGEIHHNIYNNYYWNRLPNGAHLHVSIRSLKHGSIISSDETKKFEEMVQEDKGNIAKRYPLFRKKIMMHLRAVI